MLTKTKCIKKIKINVHKETIDDYVAQAEASKLLVHWACLCAAGNSLL